MSVTIVSSGGQVVECTGTGVVTANVWELARIKWVSASAAAADECKITDTAGNILFDSFATGAQWSDEVEMGKVPGVLGVKIATLTSGQVYFYLK